MSRFLKAMVKAQAYMRENPEGTQTIMSGWLKVDREMSAEIYQLSINNFTKNWSVEESNLNLLADRMLAETSIKGVAASQLVDFALLHQVLLDPRAR